MIVHPRAVGGELLRFYRDFMAQAPDEAGGGLAFVTAPPEPFVPEEARGEPATALILVYAGDPHRGQEVFRPLIEWGEPWVKLVRPMPYVAVQQLIDAGNPWGISEYPKVDYLAELPDEAIDAAVDKAAEARSPFTQLIFGPLGGALARTDRSAMALNTPDAKWVCFCLATWQDPAVAQGEIAWARSFMDTMRPWAAGAAPPNFMSPDDPAARLRSYYGHDKFRRLVALKDKYDPDNVFALNQNVAPSVTPT
jgi:hypothetical protein